MEKMIVISELLHSKQFKDKVQLHAYLHCVKRVVVTIDAILHITSTCTLFYAAK